MNGNRGIGVMVFEPGKEPYTAVLEDPLEHRQTLVDSEVECISLPHETVPYCNVGGKRMGLPVNRQFGNNTIHGTFSLCGNAPEGHGLSLIGNWIAYFWHYFMGPQSPAVTFEVQPVKDIGEFLRLIFGDRKGGGSR